MEDVLLYICKIISGKFLSSYPYEIFIGEQCHTFLFVWYLQLPANAIVNIYTSYDNLLKFIHVLKCSPGLRWACSRSPEQRRICLTLIAMLLSHLVSHLISLISLSSLCLPLDPCSAGGTGPSCLENRLHFPCRSPAKLYPQTQYPELGKSLRRSSVELTWTGGLSCYL